MRLLRKLRHFLGWWTGHGVVLSPEEWESQYKDGHWDFIKEETERYTALSQLIRERIETLPASETPTVLDLGCGEGMLFDRMGSECHYVGMDLSTRAIERARERHAHQPNGEWIVGDFTTYRSPHPFGIVIFNESLYYAPNPLREFLRWMNFVVPGGAIIVSIYRCKRNQAILAQLKRKYPGTQQMAVQKMQTVWDLLVIRKPIL